MATKREGEALEGPAASKAKTAYVHDKDGFMETYTKLRDTLLKDPLIAHQASTGMEWTERMMDYTVPGGKLNRGMAVLDVYKAVTTKEGVTDEEVFECNAVGWCIEWLQAFFLVADDIMDNSITRRGQPCWYRNKDVGLVACNDSLILESMIYRILKLHFSDKPYYGQLLDLFHETTYQTCHGQLLDLITAPIGKVDLSKYTLDTYMKIVTYKTAYYSFYLPVALGMVLGGVKDKKAYDLAMDICVQMGQYFQIQDDYLDCYGDPEVIGKIGTDIKDNKCGWLICQAMLKATDEQKKIFEECYGKDDDECEKKVKAVYLDMDLEAVFKKYEEESYVKLSSTIEEQELLPKTVFTGLLKKIYKRKK